MKARDPDTAVSVTSRLWRADRHGAGRRPVRLVVAFQEGVTVCCAYRRQSGSVRPGRHSTFVPPSPPLLPPPSPSPPPPDYTVVMTRPIVSAVP